MAARPISIALGDDRRAGKRVNFLAANEDARFSLLSEIVYRSFMADAPDMSDFAHALDETVAWCAEKFSMFDLRDSLRSRFLEPLRHLVRDGDSRYSISETVQRVIEYRRTLLKQYAEPVNPRTSLRQGRLLAVFPTISLSHGFSYDDTGGFIDWHEIPPWDSWVAFLDAPAVLITWVPPQLASAVQCAIDCNAEDSLQWAVDVKEEGVAQLKDAGLVF